MPELVELDFVLEPTELVDQHGVTPTLDGRRLTEMVTDYERAHGLEPAGGYGGIVPGTVGDPDLMSYYLGEGEAAFPEPGAAWLLGCECGESGCWPLQATVAVTDQTVVWSGFSQPHRPQRQYEGFEPYEFDRARYESAVRELVTRLR